MSFICLLLFSLFLGGNCQKAGNVKPNTPLPLPIKVGGVTLQTTATIDANWRWVHVNNGYANCYDNGWISQYCSDPIQCVKNCQLEGVPTTDYSNVYGAQVSGNALTLKYVTGSNVGSRFYLLAPDGKQYQSFNLVNREFTFTVDASTLGCGLNGALYFVDIPLDGGLNDLNNAGAPFGTGYGDAQGPTDLKYVNGFANTNSTGSFAIEMDIWEANAYSNQIAAHACSITRTRKCGGSECGPNSYCDKPGADMNSYRIGNKTLYGPNLIVDSLKPITVITQFITDTGTDSGQLIKIQRYYKQGAKITDGGFLTDESAAYYKSLFKDTSRHAELGGLRAIGDAYKRGMTLVLSIWDDSAASMLWLDATYPIGSNEPGASRGPCSVNNRGINELRSKYGSSAQVVYSDIQVNPIRSYSMPSTTAPTQAPSTTAPTQAPSIPSLCIPVYGQCGGVYWTGGTNCCSGSKCTFSNAYYSQCLPSVPSTPVPTPVPSTPAPTLVPSMPAPTPVPSTPAPTPVPSTPAPTPVPSTPAPTPVPSTPAPTPCIKTYTCKCSC